MPLILAVPKESAEGERRVALDPSVVERLLQQLSVKVIIESGCGRGAGFYDSDYEGIEVADSFANTVKLAAVVLKVNPPTVDEAKLLPIGSVLVAQIIPYLHLDVIRVLQKRNITTLAMDLVPRITRAQPMDVLSSQATVAGYKAALLAAEISPRLFPMLTTAAGTIRPSRVIVIGAGVAGLQAIATARRLGAQVEAYDIRSAAKEQIESLGARMIDTGVEAESSGGYARALTKEEKQKQHDVLAERMSQAHAVICAAAIPGRKAPVIITQDMVEGMLPDTVIVDMAADSGGNCELTHIGETYMHGDVFIVGATNLPSSGSVHASEMYARNLLSMLRLMLSDGQLHLDWRDEILAACLLTHNGAIYNAHTAELMDQPCAPPIGCAKAEGQEDQQAAGWIAEEQLDDDSSENDHAPISRHTAQAAPEANAATGSRQQQESSGGSGDGGSDDEPDIRDDLTVIEGIGPALQNRLYAYGVKQYSQLASLDADGIHRLEIQLELVNHEALVEWVAEAAQLERK
ncbi:MAG: NAD(P)(+) transhydrogenase (Re/Si-specific) subunit alpha [Granulosicoccaceae bacterium]